LDLIYKVYYFTPLGLATKNDSWKDCLKAWLLVDITKVRRGKPFIIFVTCHAMIFLQFLICTHFRLEWTRSPTISL